MATSNPAFKNSPAFQENSTMTTQQLDALYSSPSAGSAQTQRMTYEDTIQKTVISFAILLVGAAIGWYLPLLAIPAAIAGFVLALVNIFKKQPSPPLVLTYAAVQGIFVGGISVLFAGLYDGIVTQALLGTLGVVAVTLILFRSGKIRASKRATKVFLIGMVGYAVFSLVNFGLTAFGVTDNLRSLPVFMGIPLGAIIGVFVILLAAYSLVLDFDGIKTGVERGAPRIFAWRAAFGLMVTVVWLYLEMLRLIAILRGSN